MDNPEFQTPSVDTQAPSPAVASSPENASDQLSRLEEEMRFLRRQNEMLQDTLRIQQAQHSQPQNSQHTPLSEDIFSGLDDDAFITGAQAKKLSQELREYQRSLKEIKDGVVDYFTQQEVRKIQSLYPSFQADMAQLPKILEAHPDLAAEYNRNPSPHFAMTIIKAHGKAQKSEAQRIVDNAKQSGSLSSVGGGTVEKANDWKNMSRKEFLKWTKLN